MNLAEAVMPESSEDAPQIPDWEDFAEKFVSHPDADIFPLLDPKSKEFTDLVGSISSSGVMIPIVVDRKLRVIDGRNRLKACLQTDQRPQFIYADSLRFEGSTKHLVAALNLHRRHLTKDQKAVTKAKCYGAYKEKAEETKKAAGKKGGRGNKKQGTNSSQGLDGPQKTRKTVADEAGVSEYRAQQALTVVTKAPELADKVEKGEMTLREAVKAANPSKENKKPRESKRGLSSAIAACKRTIVEHQKALPETQRNPFRTALIEYLEGF